MASLTITQTSPVANTVSVSQTVNPISLEITEQITQNTVVVSPLNITNYYGGGGEVVAVLTGVAPQSTNLGVFSGDIIVDNETIKGALQDLEDGVENNETAIQSNDTDITQLQTDISTEASTRASADTTLTNAINANTASIANLPGPQLAASLDPTELSLFFTDPGTYSSGTSLESVLRDVLIHYQTPSITSFVANGIPTGSIEHGATDTVTTATWSTVNPSNLDAGVTGSITYYDPVGTDGASYTGVAYTASPYTLNKDVTFLVTAGTAGAASTSLAQANTYYLRLSGLQNTQGTSLSASSDFFTVNYKTFVLTSPTQINASSVNSTSGNQLLTDCAAGTNGSTEEHNGLHPNSRRQTTLSYPDTANYWYLCMPQCHWEYANKITTNQGFVGFDITTTVVDCGAFVYTNAQGADVNMQLLRGPSIGQIGSGNYIKVEYDSGSPLNSAPPPVAGQPAPSPSSDLLLDTYTGAAAAYSVRKLDKDYTGNCVKVRRASDDAEADIGFDGSGNLDTSAIATHCGASNGFVSVWYDQSGNANNATQATSGNQPQIYNSTAVITENGKAKLSGGDLVISQSVTNFTYSFYGVVKYSVSACYFSNTTTADLKNNFRSGDVFQTVGGVTTFNQLLTGLNALNTQNLIYLTENNTTTSVGVNSDTATKASAQSTSTYTLTRTHRGQYGISSGVEAQELILYLSDQSSNTTGITADINNHFAIGNLPNPTSGLLATYTGAAAAYSVRQLANTAPLSMRVREDATDTETNIGFDANGDLDTAAIAAHCGSANGYVVTWYDQSGNGNDATQSTSGSQPQIYNGTAVITENGKPAIKPTSGAQYLDFGIATSTLGATGFTVLRQTDSIACVINGTSVSNYLGVGQDGSTTTIINQNTGNVSMRKDEAAWTPADRDAFYDGLATGNHLFSFYTDITTDFTDAFGYVGAPNLSMMQMQEAIFYRSNEFTSGNLSGIETDINTYFSIY